MCTTMACYPFLVVVNSSLVALISTCLCGYTFLFSSCLGAELLLPGNVQLGLTGSWSRILPIHVPRVLRLDTCLQPFHFCVPLYTPPHATYASISSCLQATSSKCRQPLDSRSCSLCLAENLCLLYPSPADTPTSLPILLSSLPASTVCPASSCKGLRLSRPVFLFSLGT